MAVGNPTPVNGVEDLYVHDTEMFETEGFTAVYIIDANRPAIIDTGTGANRESLFDTLSQLGIGPDELAYIIATHAHLDHAGGAGYLAEKYPSAEVLTPERAVPHLTDPERLIEGTKQAVGDQWRYYTDPLPVPDDRIRGLSDGETVDLGDRTLTTHRAPGHAPHHAVFYDHGDDVVFTADAAGIYVPTVDSVRQTTPPSQFDLKKARADARQIANLSPETLCFGHFGPRSFESGLLEGYSRTLVEWVETVRQSREKLENDEAVIDHLLNSPDLERIWNPERRAADTRLNIKGVLTYLDYLDAK